MFVKSLDERISEFRYYHNTPRANVSSLHRQCRDILLKLYPTQKIFEEVKIDIRKGDVLYLDFFLPLKMLAIEVHGEQHYNFSLHFHGNRWNFLESKRRDREKVEWCELNNIRLVELPYNENSSQWIERIKG